MYIPKKERLKRVDRERKRVRLAINRAASSTYISVKLRTCGYRSPAGIESLSFYPGPGQNNSARERALARRGEFFESPKNLFCRVALAVERLYRVYIATRSFSKNRAYTSRKSIPINRATIRSADRFPEDENPIGPREVRPYVTIGVYSNARLFFIFSFFFSCILRERSRYFYYITILRTCAIDGTFLALP